MTEALTIPTNSSATWLDAWTRLPPPLQVPFLLTLRPAHREQLIKFWHAEFVLPHQREPLLAQGGAPWTTWLILGGRGAGKTRAGAEWVRAQAADPSARIALIGETERDVREVMVEGVSGLLGVHEHGERPEWIATRGRVEWRNGAVAQAFSAAVVKRYRGTTLGRQELDGELIEERADALWTRAQLEACRVDAAPECSRIVVAVDPPASATKHSAACGLVAAGRAGDLIYVLADETVTGVVARGLHDLGEGE